MRCPAYASTIGFSSDIPFAGTDSKRTDRKEKEQLRPVIRRIRDSGDPDWKDIDDMVDVMI